MLIDTHCHATAPEFSADIDSVLERAKDANIQTIITIADTIESCTSGCQLANKYEQIFCTIGIHPHKAETYTLDVHSTLQQLHAVQKKIVAIGEIGLDFYYDFCDREVQIHAFTAQLQLAQETGLPVVIHCRDAWDDIYKCIQQYPVPNAVLHCCTEPLAHVEQWLALGYKVSFTGIATFPKATIVHEVVTSIPIGSFMLETDAPYLAPIPHRGQRNEPSFLVHTADFIADLRGISTAELIEKTSHTATEFFALQKKL
jgi:TatD DNase family protein